MLKILEFVLKNLSQAIITKYQPKVIGITGSVGKTSSKDAIKLVLEKKYRVRSSLKNYNNELGLPLTIINAEAQGKSAIGWLVVFWNALKIITFKDNKYPEILVLEMGVDRPGDMDYFNDFIKCNVGVITMIGSAHIEFFGSSESIAEEKGKLVAEMDKNNWAILNYDNELTRNIAKTTKAKIITYGFDKSSNLFCDSMQFQYGDNGGATFVVNYNNKKQKIFLPKVLSKSAVYASLSAIAVGLVFELSLANISSQLESFVSPKGRMNLIKGKNNSWIVDDTYNASPQSVEAALIDFKSIPSKGRKIIVLGDMLELGPQSVSEHRRIGQLISNNEIEYLITVGNFSSLTSEGARMSGLNSENIKHFSDSVQAGNFLADLIQADDLILVKGSQGIRMEKAILPIMSEPDRAHVLLVRQDNQWINK